MTSRLYSSAEEVISYTGVVPKDLKKTTDLELNTLIEDWLVQIKDYINQDRDRDYSAELIIPPGIHNIAMRACANMVMMMITRASSPIVRVDDFTVGMVTERIFTTDIKHDLMRYPFKTRVGFLGVRKVE